MLEQIHDALWVSEGEIVSFFGIAYPTRSVIARLENGDLWVSSQCAANGRACRQRRDRLLSDHSLQEGSRPRHPQSKPQGM